MLDPSPASPNGRGQEPGTDGRSTGAPVRCCAGRPSGFPARAVGSEEYRKFDSTLPADEYATNHIGFKDAPLPAAASLLFDIGALPAPSTFAVPAVRVSILGHWTHIRKRSAA